MIRGVQERVQGTNGNRPPSVLTWLPNLVLINAGTNDATGNLVDGAGQRMGSLIDSVFAEVPGAVVVLSTLIPNNRVLADGTRAQVNVDLINDQFRRVYQSYVPRDNNGDPLPNPPFKVILAEMAGFINPDEIWDQTHPRQSGQKKMAAVWD